MIENGKILFSNGKVGEIIENHIRDTEIYNQLGSEEYGKRAQKQTIQEIGEGIFGGYLYSLLDAVCEATAEDSWVDFSYSTVKNIPIALLSLYKKQKASYEEKRNATVIAKTIACILYATAMNEHNCMLRVTHAKAEPAWADALSLKLGTKREVDFLKPALDSVFNGPLQVENGIAVSPEPLIKAYKSAIGVDLSEKGLTPMLLTAE